ncbi:dsRBD fold-containing protein [Amycolatopsis orientalis]|uniref:dsRBD fold-containing protein n=1 Tax=Amycolatopsis orientalis TaxID=31958 RepID=UPI0003F60BEE|nr:dsRBD fold-containing protein [Amycolatopsis orientalis]
MTGTEPTMTDNTGKWTIDVSLQHGPYRVRAEALLRHRDGGEFIGVGLAHAGLRDSSVSQVGAYLAVARALSDLTAELLETVASDVDAEVSRAVEVTEVDGILAAHSAN